MAAILDVWIMRPGHVCRVDDHEWIVRLSDSEGHPFTWGGTDYTALPAPKAHWAGAVPPGTYVVQAHLKQSKVAIETDHAIASVCCDGTVCVRLYVDLRHKLPDRPHGGRPQSEPKTHG